MHASANPGLTIAIALGAGMIAQSLSLHLNIPAIVILLLVGALLGPEGAGWVRPEVLGQALPTLVGFAVAVVLFEGGMNLEPIRIKREKRAIRLLITVGALVTIIGATLTVRWIMAWDWRPAVLFGTLVVVTGPTVVTPLLRRIRVDSSVATILEAEAVFGDAIGAAIAVVAYEIALAPIDPTSVLGGALEIFARLGLGVLLGAFAGAGLVALLRFERVVPKGLENVFALSFVLALFQISNSLLPESGIAAAIAAGMVVGNVKTRVSRQLHEFKEGLTVMLIGLLFVLLAADVELSAMIGLGWPGLISVALLMFVVRPMAVFLSTIGSGLPLQHRLFVAWLAPRGIIAASVASLFSVGLDNTVMVGGEVLREMVFLVIFVTVCTAGFTGSLAARLIGVQRPTASGWVILGANALARALALGLRDKGHEVLCIDTNPALARAAEQAGLRIVYGNALEELTLRRAEAQSRAGFVALTSNDEVNLLFGQRVRDFNKVAPVLVTIDSLSEGATREMVHGSGWRILFGSPHRIARWVQRFERGEVLLETWRAGPPDPTKETSAGVSDRALAGSDALLPMFIERRGTTTPVADQQPIAEGDQVTFAIDPYSRAQAVGQLSELGWTQVGDQGAASAAGNPQM